MNFKILIKSLYFQVIIAIIFGILVGYFFPSVGSMLKPLGDIFINLVKMLIAPIIFGTIVLGIAKMKDLRTVGKVGVKTLIYFEVMTTVALIIGIIVVDIFQPGAGLNADITHLNTSEIGSYTNGSINSPIDFVMEIIPTTVFSGFVNGNILQVLLISVLFAIGLMRIEGSSEKILDLVDSITQVFFKIMGIVVYLAPIGAFGAMGFTVGMYGISSLANLIYLVLTVYATCLVFIFVGLGIIGHFCGFKIWKFIKYIKEELLLVLGTSSSEVALPKMISKMKNLGCDKSIVGLVIPTGYSFNLDGTCIYLTIAAIFIFQAFNVPLSWTDKLVILAVLLLTSKGAAGVTGAGFIVLSATLSMFPQVPIESLALILGIDRTLSEARALTNLIGNGVATIFIAKWEKLLDKNRMTSILENKSLKTKQVSE